MCTDTDGNYTCTCEEGYESAGAAVNREVNCKGELQVYEILTHLLWSVLAL